MFVTPAPRGPQVHQARGTAVDYGDHEIIFEGAKKLPLTTNLLLLGMFVTPAPGGPPVHQARGTAANYAVN